MLNKEIVAIIDAINNSDHSVKFPVAVAWKRRLNKKALMDADAVIEEALNELKSDFSDDERSTADGDKRMVKPEFMNDFIKRYNEIMAQETDVKIQKIKLSELDGLNLSDKDMDSLEFMIEDE